MDGTDTDGQLDTVATFANPRVPLKGRRGRTPHLTEPGQGDTKSWSFERFNDVTSNVS